MINIKSFKGERHSYAADYGELKEFIRTCLKAGEYKLAVATLFYAYTALDHDESQQFYGCHEVWRHPVTNVLEIILQDLYWCDVHHDVLDRKGEGYSCPDALLDAIAEVQKNTVQMHFPEAIDCDTTFEAMMPIKYGDYLYAFLPNEKNEAFEARMVRMLVNSHGDGGAYLHFNFFPQGNAAKESYRQYDGEKDNWGIEIYSHSYGDTEHNRWGTVHISAKSDLTTGAGYDKYEHPRCQKIVENFSDYDCKTMRDVVELLTPLYENLKEVWTDIAPDYRDCWFLPQVTAYYGKRNLAKMQELLPQVASYAAKQVKASTGGYGFWIPD